MKITTSEEGLDEVIAPVTDDGSFNASLRLNDCNLAFTLTEFPKDKNTENGNNLSFFDATCSDFAANFYNFPETIEPVDTLTLALFNNAGSRLILFEEPETGGFNFGNLVDLKRVFINNSEVERLNENTYYSIVDFSDEYTLSIYSDFEIDPPDLIEANNINISDEVESSIFTKAFAKLRIKRKKKNNKLVMFMKEPGRFKKPKFPGDLAIEVFYEDVSSLILPSLINRNGRRIQLEIDETKTPVLIQLSSASSGSLARKFPKRLRN